MALNDATQISAAWKRANDVLVVFRADPAFDAASAALALAAVIRKLGHRVDVVSANWRTPNELQFIDAMKTVKPAIEQLQKFVIEVPVDRTPIQELSYDIKDGRLRISLVPKVGSWKPEEVSAKPSDYRFDLICTVGVPDLASLGPVFETHANFFYHTPIINIDCDPANEHYGQINHVDINATSNGEVLWKLLAEIDKHLIDEAIATDLLTGMIGKTRSFKTPNVTPETLAAASELISMGGKREDIVHHLYRTRTVPVLRLWGRALARLKHDSETKLAWTVLSRQDFVLAGADSSVLSSVIDELIMNAPEARVAVILHELETTTDGRGVRGLIYANRPLSALELGKPFAATGTRETVTFELKDKTIIEAEPLVTDTLKQRIAALKLA